MVESVGDLIIARIRGEPTEASLIDNHMIANHMIAAIAWLSQPLD